MISPELLDQFYQDCPGITYEKLRSIVVEGHEVWWAKFTGQRPDGDKFTGYSVKCECDFTPGVAYELKDSHVYTLDGEKDCLPRQAALYLRRLELRREYLERFAEPTSKIGNHQSYDSYSLRRRAGEVILDLIEKAKAGEFIGEDSDGAGFWGGYFYLQTVGDILDVFYGHLWDDVYRLVAEKKIGLEGAVIQDYREPPPPKWEEFARLETDDGWVGIAMLPGHRKMAQEWKFEVLNPNGDPAYGFIPGKGLMYDPIFGPDVSDVESAKRRLGELIEQARRQPDEPPRVA